MLKSYCYRRIAGSLFLEIGYLKCIAGELLLKFLLLQNWLLKHNCGRLITGNWLLDQNWLLEIDCWKLSARNYLLEIHCWKLIARIYLLETDCWTFIAGNWWLDNDCWLSHLILMTCKGFLMTFSWLFHEILIFLITP